MLCLFNLLLDLIQYLTITIGYTYVYIDVQKGLMKFYKYVKLYVHIFNLLFAVPLLCYFFDRFVIQEKYSDNFLILILTNISLYFSNVIIFMLLIIMRIKEEKTLKKLHKIVLDLQTTYFVKLNYNVANETIKGALILNMLLIMANGIGSILNPAIKMIRARFWHRQALPIYFYAHYFSVVQHYILFRHGLILCYINDYFTKLNRHLKQTPVNGVDVRVYMQLSSILKKVNVINGPIVFTVIVSQVLTYSRYIFHTIVLIKNLLDPTYIWLHLSFIIYISEVFLYFYICEKIKVTTKETGIILRNFHEMENQQKMETICYGRLLMHLDVKVCGFTIDFSRLFGIAAEIITLAIVLIQTGSY
ncbi:uncharacterized protein ACRADG_009989 [Cochliomyia hominivorax]